tara:strand:+ start:403 stop:1098 length:696 start_codon:yes stop_codon:yes gene_type:complete
MPKFQENTGFKLPGVGSKEIDTPGVFRKDQGVEDVGYCSNTEPHMLPKGSSPLLKSSFDSVVPEYYRTSYTRTSWPVKRAKTEETKTANPDDNKEKPGGNAGDGKNMSQTVNIYNNPGGQNKKDWSNEFNKFIKPSDKSTTIPKDKGTSTNTDREKITTTKPGKSMRQAYDDALKLGFRTADESFEDYSARAKKDPNYGKGGSSSTKYYVNGREVSKKAYDDAAPGTKYKL